MNSANLALSAWGYGLLGLVYSAIAVRLLQLGYARSARAGTKTVVLAAVGSSALWGWLSLAQLLTGQVLLTWLSAAADWSRYASWYGFLLLMLRPARRHKPGAAMTALAPIAVAVMAFGLFALVFAAPGIDMAAKAARWQLLSAMLMPVFALLLLEQVFRNVSEDSRWNIKPLCLGLAGAFLFDLYLFSQAVLFNQLDPDALSIRSTVHALMAPLLLLSMNRRRDAIATVRFSPKAAFHSATLLLAGVYLLFIAAVGYYVRYFGGEWGRALQLGLVFFALIMLVLLALSGTMRARLRVFLSKHFYRLRFDYREEWLKFTRTLSLGNSTQQMGLQVIRGLADMLESPGGALWLKKPGATVFTQTASWNLAPTTEPQDADSALCRFMANRSWVINLDEYRSSPQRYDNLALPHWLQALPQAWLLVPLTVGDELIGFCVLVNARTRVELNWEVVDLLKTAGQQAASFLMQMQATEALLEARKFEAFNRMSAFVVHDLKNIVAQLSLMLKNAQRLSHNPEFQKDMLLTVEHSLERMRQLMLQLSDGATLSGTVRGVNLQTVIQRIEAVAARRGRTLEVQGSEPVVARGHEERLERVIGHVVQNAFDATERNGRVWLNLDRLSGQARIVVGDTGAGMTQEFIRERLFKPFQSTKQTGMGIGAYESYQYVQELGGCIEVDSAPDKGTTVKLLLPLFEAHPSSDRHTLEKAA